MISSIRTTPLAALWHVHCSGLSSIAPGQPYWWDNQTRETRGIVILQRTVSGQMRFQDAQGERLVEAGTLLLMRHGDATAYGRPTAGYTCRWIELAGAGLPELWQVLLDRHGPLHRATPGLDALLSDLERLPPDLSPAAEAQVVANAVFGIIAQVEEAHGRALPPVERAIEDLLARPLAVDSVEALCQRHGVSREHLARRFRARCGSDPRTWLGRCRAQQARTLLVGTDLPLAEVARQVGYGSVRALHRALTRAGHPGPAALRRTTDPRPSPPGR